MQNRNISDIIERYLKSILAEASQVEIKRSEVADQFDCVPSQINYVIKTRFTLQNGYLVDSKRGGGGYIRIAKVDLISDPDILDELIEYVGMSISETKAFQIIQTLYENELLTHKEAHLVATAIEKSTLALSDNELEEAIRAKILNRILNRLRCADQ